LCLCPELPLQNASIYALKTVWKVGYGGAPFHARDEIERVRN
jgi:hypothetical protein